MAIFGWDTLKMAEAYTRAADQQRLAEVAMHMLGSPEQKGTKSCPTEMPSGTISEKSSAKSDVKFGMVPGEAPHATSKLLIMHHIL